MEESVSFDIDCVDIVELINSPAVVGVYRGKEAWQLIEEKLNQVSERTLLMVDLRKANPLQYSFCQHAFGPIFKAMIENRWRKKYIAFQLYQFHQAGLFRGILKYLGIELPRLESIEGFVSSGMSVKLIVGDLNEITFLGNINENEQSILNLVNENKKITVRQVADKTGLPEEIIVDSFRSLVKKYFVDGPFSTTDSQIFYFSFYNYLNRSI